ncbi:hypothetical protein F511_44625 [Dorcoceras hygrometricum]|uniref:Uncharacterized protein n=1 Tax=Dorcoceras hygrometricum TaxID=472368 RepID=A0A2Z7DG08_9LAMI|nr:hypothetical protein F511_44625 [Dorcoceras hygrometricum]
MKRRRAKDSADGFALTTSSRKIPVASSMNPVASSMHPVASFAYPVDMESSRKKADVVESYNPDARFQSQYLKIQQKRIAFEEWISSEAVDDL